jgi:uncharacterized protein involved in response to NO
LWLLIHFGQLPAPALARPPVVWHAHEMFFGFGWAVLGGFLLTASKNWVGIRGYHGVTLILLAAGWVVERIGMAFGADWPGWLFRASNAAFLAAIVTLLCATLWRHRARDSYRDNWIFLLALPLFLVAKWQLLEAESFRAGIAMTTALFRVAFLVMLERTLTQFMKGVFQAEILRQPALDMTIKLLALVLVAAAWLPAPFAAAMTLLLAGLLAVRFAYWHPRKAFTRIDIGIMHLGYLGIVAQLLAEAADLLLHPGWTGALPAHLFGLGVMGLIVPAMLVRIGKGHTGRKVVFDRGDKAALWIMITAAAIRLVAPQLAPAGYPLWLALAAAGWLAGFGIVGRRLIPLLFAPRVDGKEH